MPELVPERGRPHRLLLRTGDEDQSHVDLEDPRRIEFAYLRRMAELGDALAPPRAPLDVLHVGGGALTLARYVAATRPRSRQEAAEADEAVAALVRERLPPPRGVRLRVTDGRRLLERRPDASADWVVLDAFVGRAVPEHLLDAGFVAEVGRVLRPEGAFSANVIDDPPLPQARALAGELAAALGDVLVVAARKVLRGRAGGNVVLHAARRPLPAARLRARAAASGAPELVVPLADWT